MNRYFVTLLVFLATQSVNAAFCESLQVPKVHADLKLDVEKKISAFANTPAVAKQADATLAKLIGAKSPVIIEWLKRRNLESQLEEEIARQWRNYFARNFILIRYPHESDAINKEVERLVGEINQKFASKEFRDRMQSFFEKSKASSLVTLKAMPISEADKQQIANRIAGIQLYWMKDFKESKFRSQPMDFIDWGIAYDPVANEINVGLNALAYVGDETYIAVFAHEIGHSFDSCRWSAFFTGIWPFEKIGECLRFEKGVGAKRRDNSRLDESVKAGRLSADLAAALRASPTCNKQVYPPPGVQADQLPESFADWFSAEVMSGRPNLKVSALRSDLCEEKELNAGSSYPSNQTRLERIYFSQPRLRELRKKEGVSLPEATPLYCDWKWNELNSKSAGP